jgi:hypothetical protein
MSSKAAITVLLPQDEVERLWRDPEYRPEYISETDARVTFREAPGDRGTEIHVDLAAEAPSGGKIGEMIQKIVSTDPRAKAMDDLRRFKQLAETGEITRSEGFPGGESVESKPKDRPAQPLDESELEKVGV